MTASSGLWKSLYSQFLTSFTAGFLYFGFSPFNEVAEMTGDTTSTQHVLNNAQIIGVGNIAGIGNRLLDLLRGKEKVA